MHKSNNKDELLRKRIKTRFDELLDWRLWLFAAVVLLLVIALPKAMVNTFDLNEFILTFFDRNWAIVFGVALFVFYLIFVYKSKQ